MPSGNKLFLSVCFRVKSWYVFYSRTFSQLEPQKTIRAVTMNKNINWTVNNQLKLYEALKSREN